MGDFVVVCPETDRPEVGTLAEDLKAGAQAEGLRVEALGRGWIAMGGPHPPRLTTVGPWSLIGDVFHRRNPVLPVTSDDDPLAYERKMLARFWGRFVGVRLDPEGRPAAVLRDPSGAHEAVVWSARGLVVIGSVAPAWMVARLRPTWSIDASRLADALVDPLASTGRLILDGPIGVDPGAHLTLPVGAPPEPLWRPVLFAARALDARPSVEAAAERLREAVDEAVAGLADLDGGLAAEVSGGLDSSLVAASLIRAAAPVGLWLNAYGQVVEADERRFAERLGAHLEIPITSVPFADAPLRQTDLEALSTGLRPGSNALDPQQDADWAARLQRAGLAALLTGKGGDALFQPVTSHVFADLWRARGWRGLVDLEAARLASALERPLWNLIAEARRPAPLQPPRRDGVLFDLSGHTAPVHDWLHGLEDFGPAKRLQILGVADAVSRHGPSALTRSVDVRHPLCTQPVVEMVLSLDAGLLTHGGRDRGLARHAFADRLPVEIVQRRSKGDLSRVYGHRIARDLPVLRSWLLDGRLAAMGLVHRPAMEAWLTRESLLWRGGSGLLMATAAIESWVRTWERRLRPGA